MASEISYYNGCWPIYDPDIFNVAGRSGDGSAGRYFPSRSCNPLNIVPITNFDVVSSCIVLNPPNPITVMELDIPISDPPEIAAACTCISIGALNIRHVDETETPSITGSFVPVNDSCCEMQFNLDVNLPLVTSKGPTGPQGPQGLPGPIGEQGDPGNPGLNYSGCVDGDCWVAIPDPNPSPNDMADHAIPLPSESDCLDNYADDCDADPITLFQIIIDNVGKADSLLPQPGEYLGLCMPCDSDSGIPDNDIKLTCLINTVQKYDPNDDADKKYIIFMGAHPYDLFKLYWECVIPTFDKKWLQKPCIRRLLEYEHVYCNDLSTVDPNNCGNNVDPRGLTWCRVPKRGDCGKTEYKDYNSDTAPGGLEDPCPTTGDQFVTDICCVDIWYDGTAIDPGSPDHYTRCYKKLVGP